MIDSTLSRVRMHDLNALGRSRTAESGGAGLHRPSASCRRTGPDATGIAAGTPTRPSTPSSRPETDDFVESIIS
jgi:hypothetical protein